MGGHMKTVADLAPGVVEVNNDGAREKYFVSGGFAFIQGDSCRVAAVEACSIDDLDSALVEKGLSVAQASLASASSDDDKAEAQIAVDTHKAMQYAIANN